MSRAEFLRRLASQLSSLANLEAAEAHDVQAFLEAPPAPAAPGPAPGFVALRPRSRSRSPPPKAAPGRPRGSILLSHRDRTGLSVKSCPVAPPDCSVSSPRHSCSSASGPVEPRSATAAARSSAPSQPRAAASRSTAYPARKGGQKRRASGAAEARQRKRDKHRRRVRRHIKRSMWREIQLKHFVAARCFSVVLIHLPTMTSIIRTTRCCSCSVTPPSPGLLSRMSALDERSVALTCRFSLDIFSEAQQDFPKALDDGTMPVLELEDLA